MLYLLFLMAVIVPSFLLLFTDGPDYTGVGRFRGMPVELGYIAVIILGLFIAPIIFIFLHRLISPNPALKLTNKGIYLAVSSKIPKFVDWDDIKSIEEIGVTGGKYIALKLRKSAKSDLTGNVWQKYQQKNYQKIYGTPFAFSTKLLALTHAQTFDKLDQYWNASFDFSKGRKWFS